MPCSCRGRSANLKASHATESEANAACEEYIRVNKNSDPRWEFMDTYRCPGDNGFHLGHGRLLRSSRLALERESERNHKEELRRLNWLAGLTKGGPRYDPKTQQRIVTQETERGEAERRRRRLKYGSEARYSWWIQRTGHSPPPPKDITLAEREWLTGIRKDYRVETSEERVLRLNDEKKHLLNEARSFRAEQEAAGGYEAWLEDRPRREGMKKLNEQAGLGFDPLIFYGKRRSLPSRKLQRDANASTPNTLEDRPGPTELHEAGHAAIAEHLGIKVDNIRVTRGQFKVGHTQFEKHDMMLKNETIISLAGPIAEQKEFGCCPLPSRQSDDNWITACALVSMKQGTEGPLPNGEVEVHFQERREWDRGEVPPSLPPEFPNFRKTLVEELEPRTKELVEKHWRQIVQVAKGLFEKKNLSGSDVREILNANFSE